ncbi:MAG: zinc ABC transporter substrate-binding protein [Lachnospiraceae bacterium]|nr:zinc ABC transporter substrate-binding protein [Lachnospiraceae bacterium]
MKKKKAVFMTALLLAAVGITAVIAMAAGRKKEKEGILCVTSFYPMYLLADSVAEGAENVRVVNLTENHGGCLHDYTLTTQDMRLLSEADLFLINGGGMELFLTKTAEDYKNLRIVDTSKGYTFFEETEHNHALNAHLWLDIEGYLLQLSNTEEAFVAADPSQEEIYRKNAEACRKELMALKAEYDEGKDELSGGKTVVFHEGFVYLFHMLGIETIHCLAMDSDTQISAGEAAQIIEECRLHGITRLFSEADYAQTVTDTFAAETQGTVFVLDAVTGGEMSASDKESTTPAGVALYCSRMRENLEIIKRAYGLR